MHSHKKKKFRYIRYYTKQSSTPIIININIQFLSSMRDNINPKY